MAVVKPGISGPKKGRLSKRRKRSRYKRKWRLHKQRDFVDPFPWIPGTEPEKRIFAALVQSRRYFVFQDQLEEQRAGKLVGFDTPDYVPDFVLPQWRVIIDPFGEYHHTLPEAVERDARKAVYYANSGYAFYTPWHLEVIKYGAAGIINRIPELWVPAQYPLPDRDKFHYLSGYRLGPYVGLGSKSVAAANRSRRRVFTL